MRWFAREPRELEVWRGGFGMPGLSDLLERPFGAWPALQTNWPTGSALLDVSEDKQGITVKTDLPGMEAKDVKVEVKNRILTISGERKREEEKKEKNFYRMERFYGSFNRSLALPEYVDEKHVKKTFENGVLQISIPRRAEKQAAGKTARRTHATRHRAH